MKRLLLLAVSASALLGAASANAADLSQPVVAEPFNPWMVRFRALGVIPDDRSTVFVNGTRVPGSGLLDVSNSLVPELDITYFVTRNFAFELILGTTPHTIKGSGALAGVGPVGRSWLLPPTLTAQYHFNLTDTIKPYIGAGINYTFFLAEKQKGAFTSFNVKDTFGFALQAGVDIMLNKNWGINFDVKKLFLEPKYRATLGAVPVTGKAKLNPWLIATGITYKF